MNEDGSGLRQVTTDSAYHYQPDWSPDGKKILFFSNPSGNYDLYSINPDGTGLKQLTTDPKDDTLGSWSGDGTQIAFWSWRFFPGIYTMNADGSGAKLVDGDSYVHAIAWSPNNLDLAFTVGDGTYHYCDQIYIYTLSGTSRKITAPGCNYGPRWMPNSAGLVFHSDRDGNNEIYRMSSDGSNPVRLTNDPSSDITPDWVE